MEQEINIEGQHLILSPAKALLWKEESMLIVSDAHLGKISHFRKHGIALPRSAWFDNFRRLDNLVAAFMPFEVLFLGDLFHSRVNEEWEHFCRWRDSFPDIKMSNVSGNHDILPQKLYRNAGLEIHPEILLKGPFIFSHKPLEHAIMSYNIAGHIHPLIRMRGIAKQAVTMPCFYFGSRNAILPSFGAFTGGYEIDILKGDRVFGITKEEVIAIST